MEIEELDAVPKITDLLQSTFDTKKTPLLQILNFLAASDSPAARAYLTAWRKLPVGDREILPIEAICIAARVSPLELLGAILMAAKNLKGQESALKAIMAHPEIVQSSIDNAKLGPVGFQDRKLLHESIGFLPTKQGQSIAINLLGGGQPKREDDDEDDDSFETAFPTISGKLEEWSEMRRKLGDGR